MMRTAIPWEQIDKFHAKCVCQTCTCHRHRCPYGQFHPPFLDKSTYLDDYVKKPLNPQRIPPPKLKPYIPYGDINSIYKSDYLSHKPQKKGQKYPKIRDQLKSISFDGQSQYKNKFIGKSLPRDLIINRDKIYTPIMKPFQGQSTYKASYPRKSMSPHIKQQPLQYQIPAQYKLNDETTYGNSYTNKPMIPTKGYGPDKKISKTGQHDLNTIYRKDYDQKKLPTPCPILQMPQRPIKVTMPNYHLVYNKHIHDWEEKM